MGGFVGAVAGDGAAEREGVRLDVLLGKGDGKPY